MPAAVELRNLRKSYGATEIIKGVSLTVAPSEFVVFVGPSGCGKSTLLRMIAGLEAISEGELLFDQAVVNDWDPARRRVGMVFQSYALYPHMTVEENIGFGLRLAKKPKAELKSRVEDALRILQLTSMRDKRPSQLSGGQRQRVAIGRAIVRKPNVFLFDEPLSNLDASLRGQMRMEIGKLHQTLKNTVIYVTHDQVEAMTLADRVVVFDAGIIRQIGTPMELYDCPANRFVAGFIGSPTMGFLEATVGGHVDGQAACKISGGDGTIVIPRVAPSRAAIGSTLTLGLRPEHCGIGEVVDTKLTGTVIMLERLGADTFAFIDMVGATEPVAVRLTPDHLSLTPGQKVGVRFNTEAAHAFDAEGNSLLSPHS